MSIDYDSIPMEDPLQPIWHRIEHLSTEIQRGFQVQMEQLFKQIQGNIEENFETLKSDLSNQKSSNGGEATVNDIKTAVTAWMKTYHASANADEAVRSAEEHIKVSISALENKLLEHINVKFAALSSGGSTGNNSSSGSAVISAGSVQMSDIESRVTNHITTKLNDIETSLWNKLVELQSVMGTISTTLSTVNSHVSEIKNLALNLKTTVGDAGSTSMSVPGGNGQSCTDLVETVSNLVNRTQLTTTFLEQQESRWKEMQSVIAEVRETPSFLPRDCSDIHWLHPEASSGVYEIYPSLDRKSNINAWCDMEGAKADGGWTIILRRRETDFGHTDFDREWSDYVQGFGDPATGEWWFPLSYLHVLTYRQPYHVNILMTDIEDGVFYADYTIFRVEDEAHQFRLIVDGFSGNVTQDAFKSKHHGQPFSTKDQDNDEWEDGNCAVSNKGGWWFNECHYTTLTAPFPTTSDRNDKTIRWLNGDKWLVLNDVTMRIRPVNYADRFNTHNISVPSQ
ncbi:Angiopoietin-related protein 2 [Halocaridina rubra]|uniref:Angiopoietin-related protein 2 n=1 Tax=Halocaridina rubra TaxID=373956 RepID=A0AAN8XUJ2_HALRR